MNLDSKNMSDPLLLRREKDRRRREDAFLEAAEGLFGERGFHDASMEEIAHRAGFATGTIYRYFPSKEKLYGEILHRRMAAYYGEVLADLNEAETAGEKIRSIMRAKLRFFLRNRDFIRIYTEGSGSFRSLPPAHSAPESEIREKFHSLVHDVFLQGAVEGLFKEEDVPWRVVAFTGATNAVLLSLLDHSQQIDEDRIVRFLIDMVEHGISPLGQFEGEMDEQEIFDGFDGFDGVSTGGLWTSAGRAGRASSGFSRSRSGCKSRIAGLDRNIEIGGDPESRRIGGHRQRGRCASARDRFRGRAAGEQGGYAIHL